MSNALAFAGDTVARVNAFPGPGIEIRRKNAEVGRHQCEHFSGIRADLFSCTSAARNELEMISPTCSLLMRCSGMAYRCEVAWPEHDRKITLSEFGPRTIVFTPASRRVCVTKKDQGAFADLLLQIPASASELLDGEALGSTKLGLSPQAGEGQTELCRVMLMMRDEIEHPGPAGRLYKETLALQLLVQIVRCASQLTIPPAVARGGLSARQLRLAVELLEADLTQTPSLLQLAGRVGLSPTYFCTAFKQSTGYPPHRYLLNRRIAQAKSLMADPRLSLTEIAFSSGFGSSSQFATAFRRIDGRTPTAYRRSL